MRVRGGGRGGRLRSPVKHDLWDKGTHPLSPGIKFPPTGGGGERRDESTGGFTGVTGTDRSPASATEVSWVLLRNTWVKVRLGGATAAR